MFLRFPLDDDISCIKELQDLKALPDQDNGSESAGDFHVSRSLEERARESLTRFSFLHPL